MSNCTRMVGPGYTCGSAGGDAVCSHERVYHPPERARARGRRRRFKCPCAGGDERPPVTFPDVRGSLLARFCKGDRHGSCLGMVRHSWDCVPEAGCGVNRTLVLTAVLSF